MLYLSDFDKKKVLGLVYLFGTDKETSEEEIAINCFNDALKIKEDKSLYYFIALALCRLRRYKEAQEYALKSIEKGYDAYNLYVKITVGNLAKVYQAVKVLEEGIKKQSYSACLELANLHIFNNLEPDMVDYLKASKYLNLAFEYAPNNKKGQVAYILSQSYKSLNNLFPPYKEYFKDNTEFHYLKIFNEYGGALYPNNGLNVRLFNAAYESDYEDVINCLYERFNGDSYAIFSLLFLQEEYEKTGSLNINNKGFFIAVAGTMRTANPLCRIISALCFASDIDGVERNHKEAKTLLKDIKKERLYIPERFKDFYQMLINHFDGELFNGKKPGEA